MRLITVFFVLLLSGCAATKFTEGTQSVSQLELRHGSTSGHYLLIDSNNQVVSSAEANSSVLIFSLSRDDRLDNCVAVVDSKSKPATDTPFIFISLHSVYQELVAERGSLAAGIGEAHNRSMALRQQSQSVRAELAANRAYSNQSCVLPAMAPVPPPPALKCNNPDECRQEGAAICYTHFIGTQGCGIALDRLGIPGILSSPGCSMLAASLAHEKYDLGDAFFAMVVGAVDDKASEMMKSKDVGDQVVGAAVKGIILATEIGEAQSCTENFVKTEYGVPVDEWQSSVNRIRAEPGQLQSACQSDVARLSSLATAIQQADAAAIERERQLVGLDGRIRLLEAARKPLEYCTARR